MTRFMASTPQQVNLDAIVNSPTYTIAHEDQDLLNSNDMRGVRMLLEITKPDLHLDMAGIESTIIVFGGARSSKDTAAAKLVKAEKCLSEDPDSPTLKRALTHAQHLLHLSHFWGQPDTAYLASSTGSA